MWRSWHCHCQLPLVVNCKLYRSWRHSSHCFETISCTNIRGVSCFSWTQGHTEHIGFNTWIISSLFITWYITTMLHPLSAMPSSFLPQIFLEIFFHFPDIISGRPEWWHEDCSDCQRVWVTKREAATKCSGSRLQRHRKEYFTLDRHIWAPEKLQCGLFWSWCNIRKKGQYCQCCAKMASCTRGCALTCGAIRISMCSSFVVSYESYLMICVSLCFKTFAAGMRGAGEKICKGG